MHYIALAHLVGKCWVVLFLLCVQRCVVVGWSLSYALREGEVNGWKVKGVRVSSRSRAEGSLSGGWSGYECSGSRVSV